MFLPGESPWTEVPGGLQFKSDVNERISTTQNSTASPLVKLDGWSKWPSYTFFTTFSPLIVIYILSYKHKCIWSSILYILIKINLKMTIWSIMFIPWYCFMGKGGGKIIYLVLLACALRSSRSMIVTMSPQIFVGWGNYSY